MRRGNAHIGHAAACRRGGRSFRTHGDREGRGVALTFDDGPDPAHTEAVLDALRETDARATFNVLGGAVRGREGLLQRMLADGHEIGNHAAVHERLAGRPLSALRQLALTNMRIRAATGSRPVVFRSPYGSLSVGVVCAARRLGLTTVGWDVNPRDYERPGAAEIERRVLEDARPGSIVVLHDGRGPREQTVAAAAAIVPALKAEGYELVTCSALLGL